MRRPGLLLALALLLPLPAGADYLPVGGRQVRCTWWEDGDQVVVNPFNSTNHAMTWGVERYPKSKVNVAKARSSETPEEEYCRRAFEIRAGTAEDHKALAMWCAEKKLKDLAEREWERALEVDPAHEEAKKALGPAGLKEVMRRNGKANPALGELLAQYLATENVVTRRILYQRMERDHDVSLPDYYVERAWRSGRQKKGRTDDVPLTFRSRKVKGPEGVKYTMYVPESYDPLRPTPLLVGLHGGGRGGKDGKEVVGNGPSAMNFYMGIADERGWLVACPTAIQAPWGNPVNGPFLEAMLLELQLLYNVDLNRVYLTGHSMGGFGTWFWGPEWAERWAAISPMAGGGGPAAGRLKETQTFVYVYHGADDNVVSVDPDRAAAQSLLKNGNDFAYCELNGVGHGCPQEVLEEMAAHFERKRLAVGRGKFFHRSDEIRSSFLEKPTEEEKDYLGNPVPPKAGDQAEKPADRRKRLLDDIAQGGGKAMEAAAAYAEWKDAESVKSLGARLASVGKVPDDVRKACATALGNIGAVEGLPYLHRALGDENDPVFHAALAAVVAVGSKDSTSALLGALDFQQKRFESKLMGSQMDYSDFDPRCIALGAAALAAAGLAEPKETVVARIRDRVVRPVLEAKIYVPELARAGMFPAEVRKRLALEVAQALGKTGCPAAVDELKRLKLIFPKDGAVLTACDEALAALGAAPPAPSTDGATAPGGGSGG